MENLVITCASCNFGRGSYTLAELGLEDPRNREPFRSDWDGLERILQSSLKAQAERATRIDTPSIRNSAGETIELIEGAVDSTREHFELRFGPTADGWDNWLLIAQVAAPVGRIAKVHLLVEQDSPAHAEAIDRVWDELHYYLHEKGEPNPWLYAQHHSGTTANAYSNVHWGFFAPKS